MCVLTRQLLFVTDIHVILHCDPDISPRNPPPDLDILPTIYPPDSSLGNPPPHLGITSTISPPDNSLGNPPPRLDITPTISPPDNSPFRVFHAIQFPHHSPGHFPLPLWGSRPAEPHRQRAACRLFLQNAFTKFVYPYLNVFLTIAIGDTTYRSAPMYA